MNARDWILGGCVAVALAGPACAAILGAHELPEGSGGAASTSATGATGTGGGSGTTSSSSTSTSTTTTSTTTGPPVCQGMLGCIECADCMEKNGRCNLADAGCPDGSPCFNYAECVVQCPMDGGYQGCATGPQGCESVAPPEWNAIKSCLCTECAYICQGMCH